MELKGCSLSPTRADVGGVTAVMFLRGEKARLCSVVRWILQLVSQLLVGYLRHHRTGNMILQADQRSFLVTSHISRIHWYGQQKDQQAQ